MKKSLALAFLVAVAAFAGCGGDDDQPAADAGPDAAPPTGTISLSWTIQMGGADSTCAAVGGNQVAVAEIMEGAGAGSTDPFNCTAMTGTTHFLAVGTYQVQVDLLDSTAQSLLDAPITMNGVEVADGGDANLGSITLNVP
jgi:hypothetical protein